MNESDTKQSSVSPQKNTTFMWVVGAVVVALALVLLAVYLVESFPSQSDGPQGSGEIVATVNGVEISNEEFQQQLALSRNFLLQQSGGQIAEEDIERQVVDGLINQALLLSGAQEAGVNVSESDIDTFLEENVLSQFGSQDALEQALSQNGVTIEELRASIEEQLIIEGYLLSFVEGEQIEATQEEVEAQYEQIAQMSGPDAELPPLETVYDQIAEEIRFQRLQEVQAQVLEDLRANADIEINL